ncbi:MAG: TolC family protein [Bacteriovoracaceae bacterium]|nr:TolC family protein [Bacteriovoracaceae bacterium]
MLILWLLILNIHPSYSLTLDEALKLSLKNEDNQIANANVEQADHNKSLALSAALPRITVSGLHLQQQDAAIFQSGFGQRYQRTLSIGLVQPLFSGLKEFKTMDYQNLSIENSKLQAKLKKWETYLTVVQLFFSVLYLEDEKLNAEKLRDLYEDRVSFLRGRVNIGRSRNSELYGAEAEFNKAKIELQALEVEIHRQKRELARIISSEENLTFNYAEIKLEDIADYLFKLEEHPEILSREKQLQMADKNVSIVKSDYWPTFNLETNYYIRRGGSLRDVEWDVGIRLTYPIFESGKTNQELNIALEEKNKATLEYQKLKKILTNNFTLLYEQIKYGVNQLELLETTVKLSKKKLTELQNEYKLSLVTNLEVLQALNEYILAKKNLNKTKHENYTNFHSLLILIGEQE